VHMDAFSKGLRLSFDVNWGGGRRVKSYSFKNLMTLTQSSCALAILFTLRPFHPSRSSTERSSQATASTPPSGENSRLKTLASVTFRLALSPRVDTRDLGSDCVRLGNLGAGLAALQLSRE